MRREIEARAGGSAVTCILRYRSSYDDPLPAEPARAQAPKHTPAPEIAAELPPAPAEPNLAPSEPPSRFAAAGGLDRSLSEAFERLFAPRGRLA